MPNFKSLEAAIDPNNRLTFLLDWELTMKCNLDCSYCPEGLYSGHLNSTPHPKLKDCLPTIDFMYQYVDQFMQSKSRAFKHVVLNIYGGEALFHSDIEEIVKQCHERYHDYKDKWKLSISTTTNLTVTKKKLLSLIPYIDEWTCSFHSESSNKQKSMFFENLLLLKKHGKSSKVVVLMHSDKQRFAESQNTIAWCQENNIKYLPRQIDHHFNADFEYDSEQVEWFDSLYNSRNKKTVISIVPESQAKVDLAEVGRSCCGGRLVCTDSNYKNQISFVENKFTDWKCSVNHFFLYVKQITGEVFNNKDCKTNFENKLGPVGYLSDTAGILDQAKNFVSKGTQSYTTCIKRKCMCGLCAPKAQTSTEYSKIIGKYLYES
jgi:pyruvate-formate lyase-activating enzyme